VTWSGIQSTLEQASSDALIILDCCEAGRGNIGDGGGVTELIAACNSDGTANGVGPFSFTNHLNTELRLFARAARPFTVAELYDHIYNRMESHMALGVANERYPAPVHLFLTRDQHFSRSIELAPLASPPLRNRVGIEGTRNINGPGQPNPSKRPASPTYCDVPPGKRVYGPVSQSTGARPINRPAVPPSSLRRIQPDQPRVPTERTMLFAVRLDETMTTEKLAVEAFREWFRKIPALVNDVRCTLEGQFVCDSSLLLLTIPISVWSCLRNHPAVICLGPVKSSNMLSAPTQLGGDEKAIRDQVSLAGQKRVTFEESIQDITAPSSPLPSDNWDNSGASEPREYRPVQDSDEDLLRYRLSPGPEQPPGRNGDPIKFSISGPAEVYARNISDKYPNVEQNLVERLGQANWERHERIRRALEHATEQVDPISTIEPSIFKPATVRDSGLGSSIGPLQACAQSVATSFASRADGAESSHFRVPPMPRHESGVGVHCPYCDLYCPEIDTRKEWK